MAAGDMTITNTTVRDYTFGPYHLPAGSGQQIQIDTTTNASLYLIDDAFADIVNQLYALGYVTVSSAPTPFPRVTGVPEILHGDGNPEGIVFAPQGTAFLRRDNNGIGNAIYSKTTGATLSTGWQAVNVGNAELASSSLPVGPVDGQVQRLRLGSSPYTFIRMVYDSTYAHWISTAEEILVSAGAHGASGSPSAWENWFGASPSNCDALIPHKPLTDAGLTLQLRALGILTSNGTATLDIGVQLTPYTAGSTAGSASTDASLGSTTSSSAVLLDSGWVNAPTVTPQPLVQVAGRFRTSVNNTGTLVEGTIMARWIG